MRRRLPGVRSPSQRRRTPLSPRELSATSRWASPGCSASSTASSAQQLSDSRHHCSLRESMENGGQHTSPVLAAHLPTKPEGQHPPSGTEGLTSYWLLAIVPGEQQGSTNPLAHCTVVQVCPPTPRIPAPVWALCASLTGAPAGRCPGAAEPGRAGGWGRASPPFAARRGHRDVLRLLRLQSCRVTEPQGTRSPQW